MFNRRAQVGDVARFILLHKFGGLYVDIDTIFLRDMQPFFDYEFAYKWSIIDGFNTAVLRLFPRSNVSAIIIDRAKTTRSAYTFYPTAIHTYALPNNFYRLPCAFFDAIWFPLDGGDPATRTTWELDPKEFDAFKDPFRRHSGISRRGLRVFDGAYTFHWHASSAMEQYEIGSYMDQWRRFLDLQLYDQRLAHQRFT